MSVSVSRHGIKSIINLQEVNEHANCGPPLEPSGFSYNPQEFMDADSEYQHMCSFIHFSTLP